MLESGTNRGGYAVSVTGSSVRLRPGVLAVKVADEPVVEEAGADLEQEVGAAACPAHLAADRTHAG